MYLGIHMSIRRDIFPPSLRRQDGDAELFGRGGLLRTRQVRADEARAARAMASTLVVS